MSDPVPTSTPRPHRWSLHLAWILPALLIVALVWVGAANHQQQRSAHAERAAARATELVQGFTRGDRASIDDLVRDYANKQLLTPEAAKVAFGASPSVEVVSTNEPRSGGTVRVSLRIHAEAGEIPMTLNMSGNESTAYEPTQVSLPTVRADYSSDLNDSGLHYLANGVAVTPDELRDENLSVFPGRFVLTPPRVESLDFDPPVDVALLSPVGSGIENVQVTASTAFRFSESFAQEAEKAVKAWVETCTAEKPPASCGSSRIAIDTPRGQVGKSDHARARNVTWKVVPRAFGSPLDNADGVKVTGTDPERVDFSLYRVDVVGSGEWLDGSTWRTLRDAETLRLKGTMTREKNGWTLSATGEVR